ncbi:MAG: hypothetical protein IKB04_03475 [Clostridia bacterium]|nr:hypothetical protein [Clostridia bacterium]
MVYDPFVRFPAEDPNRLWILVAGRPLAYAEAVRWRKILSGRRKLLPLFCFLMLGIFSLETLALIATGHYAWYETLPAVLAVLAATVITYISFVKALRAPYKTEFAQYDAYVSDRARHEAGLRIGFYGDRLTFTSLRGVQVLPFAEVQACVETKDGFAISNGTCWFIIRSQDLIPFDAQLIHAYLLERLGDRVQVAALAQPGLTEPLPIPQLVPPAEPLVTVSLPYAKCTLLRREEMRKNRLLRNTVVPMTTIIGVMTACYFPITSLFLAEAAVYCFVFGVIAAVLCTCLMKRYRKPRKQQALQVAFEPDGLRLSFQGTERFCIKERLVLIPESSGVTVRFLDGQTLFIPFDAVENIALLKALAGVPDNGQ